MEPAGEAAANSYTSIENLRGSSFDDELKGDDANNVLRGGLGADNLNGGAGSDYADYSAASEGVVANLVTGGTGGEAAGDTYTSIENIRGSAFNDFLVGDAGSNILRGELGADILRGGSRR